MILDIDILWIYPIYIYVCIICGTARVFDLKADELGTQADRVAGIFETRGPEMLCTDPAWQRLGPRVVEAS